MQLEQHCCPKLLILYHFFPYRGLYFEDFCSKGNKKLVENRDRVTEKVQKIVKKSQELGEGLTDNRIKILRAIIENPYIAKSELVNIVGISYTSISRNIEAMRDKYLRRVGPDKAGFWEIIE